MSTSRIAMCVESATILKETRLLRRFNPERTTTGIVEVVALLTSKLGPIALFVGKTLSLIKIKCRCQIVQIRTLNRVIGTVRSADFTILRTRRLAQSVVDLRIVVNRISKASQI